MIISRQYVTFGVLIHSDTKAKEIFMKAFEESYCDFNEKEKSDLFQFYLNTCLYQKEMDWCFSKLGDVIERFEKLDQMEPYDNGFSFGDVNKVDVVGRDEESVTIHLVNSYMGVDSIVKVMELRDNG